MQFLGSVMGHLRAQDFPTHRQLYIIIGRLYLYSCTNNSVVICTAGIIGLVWLLAYLKPKKISESAGSGEGYPSPGLTLGVRMVLALI